MPSRLALYADGLIEAGGLLALALAPLLFNPSSSRVFEPDKLALIRTLALIAAAAWLVGRLEARRSGSGANPSPTIRAWMARNPLAAPVLALLGSVALSTLGSITPAASLWGSYERLQGLYTIACFAVLFLVAAVAFRSTARVERAISVALAASVPVALYGIAQRFGLDPLQWQGADVSARVISTLGNPIFLGGYLIMVIPQALGRVLRELGWGGPRSPGRELARGGPPSIRAWGRAGLYALVLSAQVACLAFTQSRGALLGLVGGLVAFAMLSAAVARAGRRALGIAGVVAALGLMVALAGLGSLANPGGEPILARLTGVLEGQDGSVRVRVVIWEGLGRLMFPPEALWSHAGEDRLSGLRPLIGYGPESLGVAYQQAFPPALALIERRTARPDHAHNELLDAWAKTGLLGAAAHVWVMSALVYVGLRALGLLATAGRRRAFLALWLGGGASAAVAGGATLGWHSVGVAAPTGAPLGLLTFLVGVAPAGRSAAPAASPRLVVPLLAALLAHWVEIQVGIAVAATRTSFWLFAAALVAVSARRLQDPAPIAPGVAARRCRSDFGVFGLAAGLLLATLAFGFVSPGSAQASTDDGDRVLDVLLQALVVGTGPRPSSVLLWVFFGTLLAALGVAAAEVSRRGRLRIGEWAGGIERIAIVGMVACVGYLVARSFLGAGGLGPLGEPVSAYGLFVLFVVGAQLALAATLRFGRLRSPVLVAHRRSWIGAPAAAASAAALIAITNVGVVQADVVYRQVSLETSGHDLRARIPVLERALAVTPEHDQFLRLLGGAYRRSARALADPAGRAELLGRAEAALLRARVISLFDPDHARALARLHEVGAELAESAADAASHWDRALQFHAEVTRLSPNVPHVYVHFAQALVDYSEWAAARGEGERATRAAERAQHLLEQAVGLEPTFCLALAARAEMRSDWRTSVHDAIRTFESVEDRTTNCGLFVEEARRLAFKALLAARLRVEAAGEGAAFLEMLDAAVREHPTADLHAFLSSEHVRAGRLGAALQAAEAAITLVPPGHHAVRQHYEDLAVQLREITASRSQ